MYKRLLAPIIILFTVSSCVSACSSPFPLGIADKIVTSGVNALVESRSEDGSIGSYTDTAWAVMGIVASGKNLETISSPSPLGYLERNNDELLDSFNLTADLARNTLAIIAAGKSPFSFGYGNETIPDGNYIEAIKNQHDGHQFGPSESINEDFWAVTALIAAGVSADDAIIAKTVEYIIECQGDDNGWSWAAPCNEWYYASDPDNTAAAIIAFANCGYTADDEPVAKALDYLKSTQGENGGFMSYGIENASSTAWTVTALNALGLDPVTWEVNGNNPVSYLVDLQNPDGSFSFASPMPEGYLEMAEKTTADCIIALTGNTYPVTAPHIVKWWLWAVLVILITSMIAFLYLNGKRRMK